jgi:hypothetical protein
MNKKEQSAAIQTAAVPYAAAKPTAARNARPPQQLRILIASVAIPGVRAGSTDQYLYACGRAPEKPNVSFSVQRPFVYTEAVADTVCFILPRRRSSLGAREHPCTPTWF